MPHNTNFRPIMSTNQALRLIMITRGMTVKEKSRHNINLRTITGMYRGPRLIMIARRMTVKEKQRIEQTERLNWSGAGGKMFPPA